MISTPGPLELLLILGLALLVLGPTRLPDAARSAGKAVRELRDALSGHDDEDEDEFDDEDEEELTGPTQEEAPAKPGAGTEAGDPAPPPVS
jgi:sec-independent protein translocase protein TatA